MGGFSLKVAEKFLGFAGKEAAEDALRFVHEGGKSELSMMTKIFKGEEQVGYLTTAFDPLNPGSARVHSVEIFERFREASKGKRWGQQTYQAVATRLFATGEAAQLTSDIAVSTSESAQHMWGGLMRKGIAEPFLFEKDGALEEGFRITRETLMASKTASTRFLEADASLTKAIMESGSGNDNTTMLNRSMSSVRGSRRMSSAL